MPLTTSMYWLVAGTGLLLGALLFANFLPRPGTYSDPLVWAGVKKVEQDASKYAQGEKVTGKGEGKAGSKEGQKGEKGGDVAGKKGEGQTDADKGAKGGGKQGKSDANSGGKDANSKGDSGKSGSKESDKGNESNQKNNSSNNSSNPPSINIPGLEKFMKALEKIILAIACIGTVLFILYVAVYKLSYTFGWAQDLLEWLQNLFSYFKKAQRIEEKKLTPESALEALKNVSFSEFQNPFDSSDWQARDPKKLVGYTWLALLAWTKDRQIPLPDGCTPSEMRDLLANEAPAMEEGFAPFQQTLYQAQYGREFNSGTTINSLRTFWAHLEGKSAIASVPNS